MSSPARATIATGTFILDKASFNELPQIMIMVKQQAAWIWLGTETNVLGDVCGGGGAVLLNQCIKLYYHCTEYHWCALQLSWLYMRSGLIDLLLGTAYRLTSSTGLHGFADQCDFAGKTRIISELPTNETVIANIDAVGSRISKLACCFSLVTN